MPENDAEVHARRAAARAHLAKNAFQDDPAFSRLADAIESLSLAVASLAKDQTALRDPAFGEVE